MAEFNKIFTNSSISISSVVMSTLCFIDGLVVPSDKYSLTADRLDIYKQSTDSVNLFYNYNASQIFEYNLVLNTSGVIVSGEDLNNNILSNLTSNNILIFINGKLLNKNEYLVLNSDEVALLYTIPQNTFQKVVIYRSNKNISYNKIIYVKDKNEYDTRVALNSDPTITYYWCSNSNSESINGLQYNINSSIIFVNGRKLDNIYIETKPNKEFIIKSNIDPDNDLVEFYDLGTETESLNFYSTFGFSTFTNKDSNEKKIPLLYNSIITFNDIVKYVIDNIKTGFFIKENIPNGGVALVVDNNFESTNLKCYIDNGKFFQKGFYYSNEYYVSVPDVKSIVDYLASYDKNYYFIPEILEIFQQTLLKEVYDSINRIRDIRNISRVDSYHINKLIKLLGMDSDIKILSLKKRHELLEELNNWYRIVGTEDSYNIFNILQDDIKIVKMEQLFTPSYNTLYYIPTPETITYNYEYPDDMVNYGGQNYVEGNRVYIKSEDLNNTPGNYYDFSNTFFGFTVESVNNGIITSLKPDIEECSPIRGTYNLYNQDLNLKTTITTTYSKYDYQYVINTTNTQGYRTGEKLYDSNNKYELKVTGVNSDGKITSYEYVNGPKSGSRPFSETVSLLASEPTVNLQLQVSTTNTGESLILDTRSTPVDFGIEQTLTLQPGEYNYEMSGGGGASAVGDSGRGSNGDINTGEEGKGGSGQYSSGKFTVNTTSTLQYWVGAGAKAGSARCKYRWDYHYDASVPGAGAQAGSYGSSKLYGNNEQYMWSGERYRSYNAYNNSWDKITNKSHWELIHDSYARLVTSGAGGGSSKIYAKSSTPTGTTKIFGRNFKTYKVYVNTETSGGQGGGYTHVIKNWDGTSYTIKVPGGAGGNGGVSGTGAAGGVGSDGFWGRSGSNGWVRITKNNFNYNFNLLGNKTGFNIGDTLKTNDNSFTVNVTDVDSDNTITEYNVTPTSGDMSINNTYNLNLTNNNATGAELTVSSINNTCEHKYAISQVTGLIQYLFTGAQLTATFNNTSYSSYIITGTVNSNKSINWNIPSELHVDTFSNEPLSVVVATGKDSSSTISNKPKVKIDYNQAGAVYSEQEYVTFRTKEELGAKPHIEYIYDHEDYGLITRDAFETKEYGNLNDSIEDTKEIQYGKITDKVSGRWVKWWEWKRDPNWYPTNHVDIDIKIESFEDSELIMQRFIKQFYDLASTVLYIHRISACYYFGTSSEKMNSGITSIEDSPVFLGIQTTPTVNTEVYTLTADPQRQVNTNNLPSAEGNIISYLVYDNNGIRILDYSINK